MLAGMLGDQKYARAGPHKPGVYGGLGLSPTFIPISIRPRIRLKPELLNRRSGEILWRFPVLVACTIVMGELQSDGDGKEGPEKRLDRIFRRDRHLIGAAIRGWILSPVWRPSYPSHGLTSPGTMVCWSCAARPNHRWRGLVTPARRGRGVKPISKAQTCSPAERHAAMTWAQRLKRVFNSDKVN